MCVSGMCIWYMSVSLGKCVCFCTGVEVRARNKCNRKIKNKDSCCITAESFHVVMSDNLAPNVGVLQKGEMSSYHFVV